MQAAGHSVALVVELTAGVQDGEHDLRGRLPARMLIDRDAAAVVDDGDGPVDVNRDVDLVAEAGKRFVDRVVDDFVDQMVQPGRAGGPDVHRGTLPDGLEPFQDFDLVRAVVGDLLGGTVAVVPGRHLRHVRIHDHID